jgi:hypothetical protein
MTDDSGGRVGGAGGCIDNAGESYDDVWIAAGWNGERGAERDGDEQRRRRGGIDGERRIAGAFDEFFIDEQLQGRAGVEYVVHAGSRVCAARSRRECAVRFNGWSAKQRVDDYR